MSHTQADAEWIAEIMHRKLCREEVLRGGRGYTYQWSELDADVRGLFTQIASDLMHAIRWRKSAAQESNTCRCGGPIGEKDFGVWPAASLAFDAHDCAEWRRFPKSEQVTPSETANAPSTDIVAALALADQLVADMELVDAPLAEAATFIRSLVADLQSGTPRPASR